jgi:hypothetical protein
VPAPPVPAPVQAPALQMAPLVQAVPQAPQFALLL